MRISLNTQNDAISLARVCEPVLWLTYNFVHDWLNYAYIYPR